MFLTAYASALAVTEKIFYNKINRLL